MKKINLTQGKVAIVDDDDFDRLNRWKWHAHKEKNNYYALRTHYDNGKQSTVRMHREVVNPQKGMMVDHIDGDGLNNSKENLRICSAFGNARNARKHKNKSSRFKGVFWNTEGQRWRAVIRFGGRNRYLGVFKDEEDAAIAYNVAAQLLYGEYASINNV